LQCEVELSAERVAHVQSRHPELPPSCAELIARTLEDPDEVRGDQRFAGTHLFSRWFDDLLRGKILVVAVVTDTLPSTPLGPRRRWVVTAYPTRRVTQGEIEWQRL
jgi:hypothetical protein